MEISLHHQAVIWIVYNFFSSSLSPSGNQKPFWWVQRGAYWEGNRERREGFIDPIANARGNPADEQIPYESGLHNPKRVLASTHATTQRKGLTVQDCTDQEERGFGQQKEETKHWSCVLWRDANDWRMPSDFLNTKQQQQNK